MLAAWLGVRPSPLWALALACLCPSRCVSCRPRRASCLQSHSGRSSHHSVVSPHPIHALLAYGQVTSCGQSWFLHRNSKSYPASKTNSSGENGDLEALLLFQTLDVTLGVIPCNWQPNVVLGELRHKCLSRTAGVFLSCSCTNKHCKCSDSE